MQYRLANPDDSDNLALVHAESWRVCYRGIFPDEFLDKAIWEERRAFWTDRLAFPKHNQRVLIATDDNEPCGFICAFGNESPKWGTFIDNLHVSEAAQGSGVGQQLMCFIAQWADESFDHKGLYLEVLEGNLNARRFYEKLGAKHQETNLWQLPGSDEKVNDCLYVWESSQPLLRVNNGN